MSNKRTFEKITDSQARKASIETLSDRPNKTSHFGEGGLSAQQLKQRFDALPELSRKKINEIIAAFNTVEGAKYIGINAAEQDNLYDFLALFKDATEGGTNIADYIKVYYEKISESKKTSQSIVVAIQDLLNGIATAKSDISELSERVTTNEDNISSARDRVNGLADNITTAIKKANNNASRLTSIERYLGGEFFVADNSFNYEKDVPENALAKAKINSIGGMTYKSKNLYNGEQDITCSGSAMREIIFDNNITEPVTMSFRHTGSVESPDAAMVEVLLNDGTIRYVSLSSGEAHFDNLSRVVLINYPKLSGALYDIQIEYGDVRTEFEPYYEGLRDTKVAQILCDSNLLRVNDFVYRQTDTMPSDKDRAISAFIPFKNPMYVKANNIPDKYLYEIDYYKSPEYTSSASAGYSGWITDTNIRVANQYNDVEDGVKYIAILVGGLRGIEGVTYEVTREVIESFDFQVTYDSGSTYVGDLTVPEEVRNLPNYGAGINGGCYNYLNHSQTNLWKYYQHVGCVDLGDLDWFYDSGARVFTAPLILAKIDTLNLLSDMYATSKYSSATSSPDMSIYGRSQDGLGSIGVKNSNYSDAAEFKAAMSGVIVYYELATPIVTDVSEYMKTNLINVEGGSHLTARSNTNKPVWYSAKYLVSYKEEDK